MVKKGKTYSHKKNKNYLYSNFSAELRCFILTNQKVLYLFLNILTVVEFFKSLCSLLGKDFLIHNANTELFNHTTTAFTNLWFVAFDWFGPGAYSSLVAGSVVQGKQSGRY